MSNDTARSTADAMSGEQYRQALEALDITQGRAAQLLGVDARTSRKWATGEREVPPTAARFLRLLIILGLSPEKVITALDAVQALNQQGVEN